MLPTSINITEALATLSLLEGCEGLKLADAVDLLGMSVPTIKRHIRVLRSLGVQITWSHKDRAYLVGEWGIFNREKAIKLLNLQ